MCPTLNAGGILCSQQHIPLEPLIYDIDESAYLFEECLFIVSFADHCAAECSFVCVCLNC